VCSNELDKGVLMETTNITGLKDISARKHFLEWLSIQAENFKIETDGNHFEQSAYITDLDDNRLALARRIVAPLRVSLEGEVVALSEIDGQHQNELLNRWMSVSTRFRHVYLMLKYSQSLQESYELRSLGLSMDSESLKLLREVEKKEIHSQQLTDNQFTLKAAQKAVEDEPELEEMLRERLEEAINEGDIQTVRLILANGFLADEAVEIMTFIDNPDVAQQVGEVIQAEMIKQELDTTDIEYELQKLSPNTLKPQ
jgi:hypothetical protein